MTASHATPVRIALVADPLVTMGGAEQVFLYIAQAFPDADIYSLAFNPECSIPELKDFCIRSHWTSWLFKAHRRFKLLFPLATLAMESWRLGEYDIILLSSATAAKYLPRHDAVTICYCYFPTRALWDQANYFRENRSSPVLRIFSLLLPWLQKRDSAAARRVDYFIAISQTSRQAISRIYSRDADVLFCPIVTDRFAIARSQDKRDYFLLVSRLEQWKRVDYAIEAFNRMGLPLHIVGTGEDEKRLRALAGSTITFRGRLSMDELIREYGRAQAVIFTPALEYGLVPLEAVAAGTPVIALGYGGVRETMIGLGEEKDVPATAVFFDEQTPQSLMSAMNRFREASFDRDTLMAYARHFDVAVFQENLRDLVSSKRAAGKVS